MKMPDKTRVDEKWESLVMDDNGHVRKIVRVASRHHVLRQLFPFAGHNDLRFSVKDEYPYDWDLPYVRTTPYGGYEARVCDGIPIIAGNLDEVVMMVADAMVVALAGESNES
ncbi:DUF6193 family natural product biosynthesis protein [Pendulispora brunnea]|uniref:DUF6193 family natural product biosynthesis protein n=1 Tax=Pendulispora brunnea TaxID=2905690 RepID=A0ABZ2KL01_9BACT